MRTTTVVRAWGVLGATSLLLAGCGASGDEVALEETGAAELAIVRVPDDVGCIHLSAVGTSRTVEKSYDVVAGQRSVLPLMGLPLGTVQFSGQAFDGACAAVTPSSVAGWVGGPVPTVITTGRVAQVTLILRRNNNAIVTVDFEIDPETGEPCVDPERPECLNPDDAFGDADAMLPPGARLVSPADFVAALESGNLILSNPARVMEREQADEDQIQRNRAYLAEVAASDPELGERIQLLLQTSPEEDDTLRRINDGDELTDDDDYTLALSDQAKVVTMGRHFAFAEAAGSLREFGTRENQLGLYQAAYRQLPAGYLEQNPNLPSPDVLADLPVEEIRGFNDLLAADLINIIPFLPDLDLQIPPSCNNEIGAPSVLTDQTGSSCTPSANGIFGSHDFPLKDKVTCVKNQASRGTCVSFGIAGAIEAAIARDHNQWVNLSEQRLYYWAKEPTAFGDGLNTSGTMNNMVSTAFTFPWEFDWDYNPSQSRSSVASTYVNSCVGYSGEHCSDTSHQGDRWCVKIAFWTFCGWDGSAPASSGYRMTGTQQLFDFGKPFGSLLGRLHLALGRPLVMSFEVTPSFDNAASNGVVTYLHPFEGNRGGHAVAVVGYVDNDDLPDGVPNGSGGGYFIIKNSWGQCWKDGGYAYLPYNWVEAYAYSLKVVNSIN